MSVTANSVVTPQIVRTATAVCTAAKTTYNDNANAVRLIGAATNPNGALVKRLFAIPRSTVGATQLQLYRSPDAGTTLVLAESALMSAYTMAQTTAAPKTDFGYSDGAPMRLAAGEELWAGIGFSVTGGIAFIAEYEAY